MIAIITAGGEAQPGKPMYDIAGGGLKALIDVAGKPMVQWVLDAFNATDRIDQVIVVGLPPETSLDCAHPLLILPDHGGMLNNIRAGAQAAMRIDPAATHALVSSSDIPMLQAGMVEWLIDQCLGESQDLYYTVIYRETIEKQFPNSNRTFLHLKNAELCGGDIHCIRLQAAVEESPFWNRLIAARKSPLKQAAVLGYDTLFFLILRQMSLKDAEVKISERLGIRGKAVISSYAEMGMDVDKPFQLEIAVEHLARSQAKKLEPIA